MSKCQLLLVVPTCPLQAYVTDIERDESAHDLPLIWRIFSRNVLRGVGLIPPYDTVITTNTFDRKGPCGESTTER